MVRRRRRLVIIAGCDGQNRTRKEIRYRWPTWKLSLRSIVTVQGLSRGDYRINAIEGGPRNRNWKRWRWSIQITAVFFSRLALNRSIKKTQITKERLIDDYDFKLIKIYVFHHHNSFKYFSYSSKKMLKLSIM